MKRIGIALLLCLLVIAPAVAEYILDTDWANYTYQVRYEDGTYVWSLRNERWDVGLVTWTWAGGVVGQLPGSFALEKQLPLPPAYLDHNWYQRGLYSASPPVTVMATMVWADGKEITKAIRVPTSAVPEPSSLLALAIGLIGLASLRRSRHVRG